MHRPTFWLLIALLLGGRACHAHGSHLSTLKIIRSTDNKATIVSVSTHLSELRQATPAPISNLDYAFRQRVRLRLDGKDFIPTKTRLIADPANDSITWQATHPGPGRQVEVLARLYPEQKNSELTVAIFEDGRIREQTTLSGDLSRITWNDTAVEKTPSVMHSVTEGVSGLMQPLSGNATLSLAAFIGLLLLAAAGARQRRREGKTQRPGR